jgi:hypothetical protein
MRRSTLHAAKSPPLQAARSPKLGCPRRVLSSGRDHTAHRTAASEARRAAFRTRLPARGAHAEGRRRARVVRSGPRAASVTAHRTVLPLSRCGALHSALGCQHEAHAEGRRRARYLADGTLWAAGLRVSSVRTRRCRFALYALPPVRCGLCGPLGRSREPA